MGNVIKNIYKESDEERILNGNKVIEFFMGVSNVNIFNNENRFKIKRYDQSWDLLMMVIKKIKSLVFKNGYDMFMPEHLSYISIGSSCYDAELFDAWGAVVRWIMFNYDLSGIDIAEMIAPERKKDPFYMIAKKTNPLKVSPQAVNKYKEKVNKFMCIKDICNVLSPDKLWYSYERNGDGWYYLDNRITVFIDSKTVKTISYIENNTGYINYEKISNN